MRFTNQVDKMNHYFRNKFIIYLINLDKTVLIQLRIQFKPCNPNESYMSYLLDIKWLTPDQSYFSMNRLLLIDYDNPNILQWFDPFWDSIFIMTSLRRLKSNMLSDKKLYICLCCDQIYHFVVMMTLLTLLKG